MGLGLAHGRYPDCPRSQPPLAAEAPVCACAHGGGKGPAMSRAVERNKAQNHLERDPPGTNACWTKVCLVLPPPSRYKNRQPKLSRRRAWCHGLAEHSDIVHPVSSSQLTEARNRV